ncbi:hypothetical protein BRO54_0878 [Geobacillus proteiniphilus]|uniref:Uncharacterized protein n=1 Tax=Geobacillus proteiniphilus TaxID=860353 RepID=A0A1Q5T5E5_9BACL|nr:hypothetical protein BRO54_0878 [Geobacillus proteiniphilus]
MKKQLKTSSSQVEQLCKIISSFLMNSIDLVKTIVFQSFFTGLLAL